MYPKIFELVSTDAQVQIELGTSPVRFFPFGYAPQNIKDLGVYAVFQTVSGTPYNTLICPPDMDAWQVQVDVYGADLQKVRSATTALVEAIENSSAYIQNFRGESHDFETKRFRSSFDVSMIQSRS